MNQRFISIFFLAMFLSLFTVQSFANVIPDFAFRNYQDGLLLKSLGYEPTNIYSYTKSNNDQTVTAVDAVTKKEYVKFNLPTYVGITSLSLLSADPKNVLFGCSGVVSSYEFSPNTNVERTFDNSTILLGDTASSFDGEYFITMPTWYFIPLRSISVFNAATLQKTEDIPITGSFTSLDVATKSNTLAAGTKNSVIFLWPFPSKNVYTLNKHTAAVNSVSFSYDNKFLLSASDDKTILLWDIKTREVVYQFNADEEVKAVQWMPNDKYFASVGSANLMIWNVASKKCVNKVKLPSFLYLDEWRKNYHARFLLSYSEILLNKETDFLGTLIQFDAAGKNMAIQQKYFSTIQIWENKAL